MPLSIPAFDQYQQPMVPLRGLWNKAPEPEGDRFVAVEIDWLITTTKTAVQFSLSGNSPVSMSQIVAMAVDNSRSGADVSFIFPDTGFQLVIPAHIGGVYPVFTNALMFYASAVKAIAGDVVSFLIFNSMPPPVAIAPSIARQSDAAVGVSSANASTQVIATAVSGTLTGGTISYNFAGVTTAGAMALSLVDGTGKTLWVGELNVPANPGLIPPMQLSGLTVRFQQGVKLVISGSNIAGGALIATLYYTTP